MRALGIAIARGLAKGLVIGLSLGLVLTYALRWPVPVGSLLGYLAAMAACGTTGIAGGKAPWKEGAWLVAALKAVAGVAVGALLYWVLGAHLDASLPEGLAASLALPGLAPDEATSWIAFPPLALMAVSATFGLLVEIDDVGGEREDAPAAKAAAATRNARPSQPRTAIETADTGADDRPARTRRERPSDRD